MRSLLCGPVYLREGCSSLFTYCTHVLRLEEAAAYNRIEVARAARRFPAVLDGLHDGSLTLAAVRLLAPHLTVENHGEVLASARHKSKRDVERVVATLAPRPEAPALIRKLPARADCTRTPPDVQLPVTQAAAAVAASNTLAAAASAAPGRTMSPPARPTLTPVAPERYTVRVTISAATHEKLQRVRDLLRHAMPDGDLEAILDRALTLLLEDVERRRFAATLSPRAARQCEPGSRHIPAAVRRQVWRRDGGQCAFVGAHGRCTERGFLEFHHVQPYAAGGAATAENIELRCKSHNAYEASLFFGVNGADSVREDAVVYSLSNSRWQRSVCVAPRMRARRVTARHYPFCSRSRRSWASTTRLLEVAAARARPRERLDHEVPHRTCHALFAAFTGWGGGYGRRCTSAPALPSGCDTMARYNTGVYLRCPPSGRR